MEFSVKISIVMPVYNTEISILRESVDSMLAQTLGEFEFIIIDDHSGPETRAYLQGLKDPRVHLIRNETNLGVTKSLNVGFRAAKGKYIARMDADDISLPARLEKQYGFMEAHPEVIVCGSKVEIFGTQQRAPCTTPSKRKLDMDDYRIKMLFTNPGPYHPTAFFSHEKLLQHHILYDEKLVYAQDYGMWETVSHYGEVKNLNEVLLRYRTHPGQISMAHRQRQIQCDKMTQSKILTALLGPVTDDELDLHYVYSQQLDKSLTINPKIVGWYRRLIAANRERKIYPKRKFEKYVLGVELRLIEQTCGQDSSPLKMIPLFFRYLPFATALRATGKAILQKNGLKAF